MVLQIHSSNFTQFQIMILKFNANRIWYYDIITLNKKVQNKKQP